MIPRLLVQRAVLIALLVAPGLCRAAPPSMTRDEIICRAKSGLGYSYWWGGSCWCSSGCSPHFSACGSGTCNCWCGSCCPDCCSHSGSHGADCSGYTYTAWRIAGLSASDVCGPHGPASGSYTTSTSNWTVIGDGSRKKGDSVAKSGHVMIFESNTSWGGIWVYEAKGCNYGVVHNTRSVSWGTWTVAERKNLVGTQCSPGQVQTQGCGKCGSKERTCSATGNWGSWGGCAGRGPCSPGQTQSQGCGNCGNKGRSCQSNCQWGGWGSCQGQGSCAPGQVNTEGCGNCGNHGRSCQSNCQWGGWGSCEGQGPCAPGQVHTEDCGDCGTHTRGCQTNCYWADWSPCEGPDPGDGKIPCDTGELGVCADGRQRCHQGWVTCVRLVDPSDELCDGLDNDCDGPVDEDRPQFMGFSPPAHAADLVELSYKPVLGPGETGQAWAVFVNRGSEAWSKREIWLRAAGGEDGEESRFRVPGAWPAWDVAAVLPEDVPPGGMARLEFTVRAPVEPAGWFHERFVLLDPDGEEIRCPRPDFQLSIQVGSGGFAGPQSAEHEAVEPFPDSGPPDLEAGTRGGCGVVPSPQPGGGGGPWFILLMLAVSYAVWHRKTRCVK